MAIFKKLQKSGILRKALEHLNMVDDTIKNLRTENSSYRSALNAIRLQLNSAQTGKQESLNIIF